MQGGIKRALFHGQQFIRGSLDMQHDSIAVQLSHLGERLQNQKVESSLEIISCHFQCTPRQLGRGKSSPRSGGMSTEVWFRSRGSRWGSVWARKKRKGEEPIPCASPVSKSMEDCDSKDLKLNARNRDYSSLLWPAVRHSWLRLWHLRLGLR